MQTSLTKSLTAVFKLYAVLIHQDPALLLVLGLHYNVNNDVNDRQDDRTDDWSVYASQSAIHLFHHCVYNGSHGTQCEWHHFSFFLLSYLGWHMLPSHASTEACLTGWPNA